EAVFGTALNHRSFIRHGYHGSSSAAAGAGIFPPTAQSSEEIKNFAKEAQEELTPRLRTLVGQLDRKAEPSGTWPAHSSRRRLVAQGSSRRFVLRRPYCMRVRLRPSLTACPSSKFLTAKKSPSPLSPRIFRKATKPIQSSIRLRLRFGDSAALMMRACP